MGGADSNSCPPSGLFGPGLEDDNTADDDRGSEFGGKGFLGMALTELTSLDEGSGSEIHRMPDHDYSWDYLIEHASPKSKGLLLQPFYWECCDDDSPLGNDTGADTFCGYAQWRADHPRASVE